jgi:hypothetical protein
LVIEELHESGRELAHFRVLPGEEEDHSLEELFAATGSILLHKLHEDLFVLDPVADGVTLRAEEPAEEDPVAELGPESQSGLEPLNLLCEDGVKVSLSLLLGDNRSDFGNSLL